jgi:ribosomal-protein-alanine N-acetyltransferase
VITAPEQIVTRRLLLRKPVRADAGPFAESLTRDPDVMRYMMWRTGPEAADAEEFVASSLEHWRRGTSFTWSIVLRAEGVFAGVFEARVDAYMVNVAYAIGRAHWNNGFATEALRAVCAWTDAQKDVFRVWAVCAAGNPASVRVLEKAGMTREGTLRRWAVFPHLSGEPQDCFSYARVRESTEESSPRPASVIL